MMASPAEIRMKSMVFVWGEEMLEKLVLGEAKSENLVVLETKFEKLFVLGCFALEDIAL